MNFNGTSHKLSRAGSVAGMLNTTSFTIFAICRPSSVATNKKRIISFGTAARGWAFGLTITDGFLQITYPGVDESTGTATTAAVLNVWQLLAVVYPPSGSDAQFYRLRLDTNALATESGDFPTAVTAPQAGDTLNIGTWVDGASEWYQGDISWVGYIPAALTQAGIEVLAFMPRKFPGAYDLLAPLYDGGIDLFAGNGLTNSGATVGMTPMISYGAPLIFPLAAETAAAEASLTGTITEATTEDEIVAGGKVITLTLTGTTFVPA